MNPAGCAWRLGGSQQPGLTAGAPESGVPEFYFAGLFSLKRPGGASERKMQHSIRSTFGTIALVAVLGSAPLGAQEVLQATFRLGAVTGSPGQVVEMPLYVSGNSELAGLQWSIDYDEDVLEGIDVVPVYRRPDGAPWEFFASEVNVDNELEGNAGTDEGFFVGGALFEFALPIETEQLPTKDEEHHILSLRLRVRETAAPGETSIEFSDGAPFRQDVPGAIFNIVVLESSSINFVNGQLGGRVEPLTIDARVEIIGDISIFVRGDTNGDLDINLTDPLATLNYLFLGFGQPRCPDAADANDDGEVSLSDALFVLNYLFLGGSAPPPPSDHPGIDRTLDSLGPCRTPSS